MRGRQVGGWVDGREERECDTKNRRSLPRIFPEHLSFRRECPLSGWREKVRGDFGSCPIGNSSRSGTNGGGRSFRRPLYAKYSTAAEKRFLLRRFRLYAVFSAYPH